MESTWRYGLCDCCEDPSWCLIGYFCPVALIYGIMERTSNGRRGKGLMVCIVWATLMFLAWQISSRVMMVAWLMNVMSLETARSLSCLLFGLFIFSLVCYYVQVARLRSQFRHRYGIKGHDDLDCLTAFCCSGVLHQMYYEAHNRENVEIIRC